MSLNLINFPFRADSSFTGRRAGSLTVESVHRRSPTNGTLSNSDYAAVLRHDDGNRAVVPYSRLVSALRTANPVYGVTSLYNEARRSGSVTPATSASVPKAALPVSAGSPINTATEAARQAQLGTIINGETALDLMTALVKAARQDPKVAAVVKSLSALV